MPGKTTTQTVAGAGQFTGLVGAGLFQWSQLDAVDMQRRVCVTRVSYATAVGDAGDVLAVFRRPGGLPTERSLVGSATQAQITTPGGTGDVTFSPGILPRDGDGTNWELVVTTSDKDVDGTVVVDWTTARIPDDTP